MNKSQIEEAIGEAQRGIVQYLEIMELLHKSDVSLDRDFQRKYNAFYRVRQRTEEWYESYYSYLEKNKNSSITFANTIDYLNASLGRYEPSFSSKLAATINPNKPVWDRHVLNNTGHTAPPYYSPTRVEDAKIIYSSIEEWYITFLQSDTGRLCVNTFNEKVFRKDQITDLKKVDFILWKIRD